MQEWCTCSASFRTRSYRRLLRWRNDHRHEATEQPEPEPQGAQAVVERSFQEEADDFRLGFQPDPMLAQAHASPTT